MLVCTLLACAGSDEVELATEPDPGASRAVADALCELTDGAHKDCERVGNKVTIEGEGLQVAVFLDKVEEKFGQYTFDGRAVLTRDDGAVIATRFQHYGWGRDEALDKGTHYWAVLSGPPVVDWLLQDPQRPALKALERDKPASTTHWTVGEARALRGWTLLQGVVVDLEHDKILEAIAPRLATLDASAPHVSHIRIVSDMGEQKFICHVDGAEDAALCDAAKAHTWPPGIGWELQQVYLSVPAASFPEAPPQVEVAPNAGEDEGAP